MAESTGGTNRSIAQSGLEQFPDTEKTTGSNPVIPTKCCVIL